NEEFNGDTIGPTPGPDPWDCVAVITLSVENINEDPGEYPTNTNSIDGCSGHGGYGDGSKSAMAPKEVFDSGDPDSGTPTEKRWRKVIFRRFVTAPTYQRRGIGRELLSHVLWFAECKLEACSISTHSRL